MAHKTFKPKRQNLMGARSAYLGLGSLSDRKPPILE